MYPACRCPILAAPPPNAPVAQGDDIPGEFGYEFTILYPPGAFNFIDIIPTDNVAMPGVAALESTPGSLVDAGEDVLGVGPVPV